MATVEIENPEKYDDYDADDRGRVVIGKEYSGKTVRICVEEVVEENSN